MKEKNRENPWSNLKNFHAFPWSTNSTTLLQFYINWRDEDRTTSIGGRSMPLQYCPQARWASSCGSPVSQDWLWLAAYKHISSQCYNNSGRNLEVFDASIHEYYCSQEHESSTLITLYFVSSNWILYRYRQRDHIWPTETITT